MKGFWEGKSVLITGHTGFKGSWLSLWLLEEGAKVIGYSLKPPTEPNLFNLIKIERDIISIEGDIRNIDQLDKVIKKYKPQIVFHLAAQPLVRKSYQEPIKTLDTNIMGTINLLECIRNSDSVKVVLNVTSDKCYENKESYWGYREIDEIGGNDPYSCSKGCSELITKSYRKSFLSDLGIHVSTVRAGNVIGGGDWAEDRLIPDIIKAISRNEKMNIRNPYAVRPWQHVLEPIYGYILLAEKMWNEGDSYAGAWNFGPDYDSMITVGELTNKVFQIFQRDMEINYSDNTIQYETQILKLDCTKSKIRLGWNTIFSIDDALLWTTDWYRYYLNNEDLRLKTIQQINHYKILRNAK